MPKTRHRNVVLVVPDGEGIDAVLERADPTGTWKRVLRMADAPSGRDAIRRLMAGIYLAGMREGVDRGLAAADVRTPLPALPAPQEPAEVIPEALLEMGAAQRPRSPVQMVVEKFRTEELRLPAMPEIAQQLNRLLANPDHDIAAVLDLVRRDVALTARVMKLGASPAYTLGGRSPRNLHEAVVRLGARELGKQLMAFSNRRLFQFKCRTREHALRDLWHHALATGVIAEHLAGEVPGLHAPTCFLHGMLHDIGRALLLQIFDEIEQDGATVGAEEVDRTIASLHGQFGAALLQRWRFDESFAEVAMFHHQPQKAFNHMKIVACVSLAATLATRAGYGRDQDPFAHVDTEHHPASAFLGLEGERLAGIDAHVRRQFEVMADLT